MNLSQKSAFLAGFDLAAQRKEDGFLHAYLGPEIMQSWPTEIEMCGNKYKLEDVVYGQNGYESAIYA